MSSQADFSSEEWALLRDLPFQVILGMIAADARGPLGAAAKESVVAARQLVSTARELGENELIAGLLADYAGSAETPDTTISLASGEARAGAMSSALSASATAVELLATRSGEVESEQYRRWVYDAARAAAEATRSGGFLGLGTKVISEEEEAYLARLADALKLPSA